MRPLDLNTERCPSKGNLSLTEVLPVIVTDASFAVCVVREVIHPDPYGHRLASA